MTEDPLKVPASSAMSIPDGGPPDREQQWTFFQAVAWVATRNVAFVGELAPTHFAGKAEGLKETIDEILKKYRHACAHLEQSLRNADNDLWTLKVEVSTVLELGYMAISGVAVGGTDRTTIPPGELRGLSFSGVDDQLLRYTADDATLREDAPDLLFLDEIPAKARQQFDVVFTCVRVDRNAVTTRWPGFDKSDADNFVKPLWTLPQAAHWLEFGTHHGFTISAHRDRPKTELVDEIRGALQLRKLSYTFSHDEGADAGPGSKVAITKQRSAALVGRDGSSRQASPDRVVDDSSEKARAISAPQVDWGAFSPLEFPNIRFQGKQVKKLSSSRAYLTDEQIIAIMKPIANNFKTLHQAIEYIRPKFSRSRDKADKLAKMVGVLPGKRGQSVKGRGPADAKPATPARAKSKG